MVKSRETKWLKFEELSPKKKTRVFSVWSKCGDFELGQIKWYPSWRHYTFIIDIYELPPMTSKLMFSDRCQFEIGEFIKKLNEEHKKNSHNYY